MWIFSQHGFFTFVVDRKDPSQVWLRARMREHLEDNFPGLEVIEKPGADYLFRAKVSKVWLAEQMTRLIMDADITSHFKDEMNRRAAKPKWGSISQVMYSVWRGAAEWQPYAPYSKVPRPAPKPIVGKGQAALFSAPNGAAATSSYGGWRDGETSYSRDYDWSQNPWSRQGVPVGESAPDPRPEEGITDAELAEMSFEEKAAFLDAGVTDDELERIWITLTDEERDRYLDDAEEAQRALEELEAEHAGFVSTAAAPAPAVLPGPQNWREIEEARRAGDRNRQQELMGRGRKSRKERRRAKRRNRHNQQG